MTATLSESIQCRSSITSATRPMRAAAVDDDPSAGQRRDRSASAGASCRATSNGRPSERGLGERGEHGDVGGQRRQHLAQQAGLADAGLAGDEGDGGQIARAQLGHVDDAAQPIERPQPRPIMIGLSPTRPVNTRPRLPTLGGPPASNSTGRRRTGAESATSASGGTSGGVLESAAGGVRRREGDHLGLRPPATEQAVGPAATGGIGQHHSALSDHFVVDVGTARECMVGGLSLWVTITVRP